MYQTLYNFLATNTYDLTDILDKIEYYFIASMINNAERESLIETARAFASNAIEYNVTNEIQALWAAIHELQAASVERNEDESDITEFVHPTGAHDCYNIGDRVRFNNCIYESVINNNNWSPTEYPQGWTIIE